MSIRQTSLILVIVLAAISITLTLAKMRVVSSELASVREAARAGSASSRLNEAIIELSLERSLMQVALNLPDAITNDLKDLVAKQRRLSDEGFADVVAKVRASGSLRRADEFLGRLTSLREEIGRLRERADQTLAGPATERRPAQTAAIPTRMKLIIEDFAQLPLLLRWEGASLAADVDTLQDIQKRAWEVREYGGQERTYFAIAAATGAPIAPATLAEMRALDRRAEFSMGELRILADFRNIDDYMRRDVQDLLTFYQGPYKNVREGMVEASQAIAPYATDFASFFELSNDALGRAVHLSYVAGDRIEAALERRTMEAKNELFAYAGALILTLALCFYLAYYIWVRVCRRIVKMTHVMTALADGDVSIDVSAFKGSDEVGRMARCVDVFRHSTVERMRLEEESRLLNGLDEWLQVSKSLDELFENSRPFIEQLLPESDGTIYIYSSARDVLHGVATWRNGSAEETIRPGDCWALRRGRHYTYGATQLGLRCAHDNRADDGRLATCLPILAEGKTIGLMHLSLTEGGSEERFLEGQRLARTCAEHLALAVANVQLRDTLHQRSIRDPLTGLYNRRFFTDALQRTLDEARATGEALSVVSLDVDHFKKFNDTFGHDAGDTVLRELAGILEADVSGREIACRLGGEEFVFIWPGLDAGEALARADAVRTRVEAHRIVHTCGMLPTVTISLGIAQYGVHGKEMADLMRAADEALYEAKRQGRNRSITADPDGPAAASNAIALTAGASDREPKERPTETTRALTLVATPSD